MPDTQPADTNMGLLLVQVCGGLRQHAERALRRVKLHAGQDQAILRLCGSSGMAQCELTGRLGCTPATVTNMLQRLERGRLIRRERDLADGRVTRVSLTAQGQALEEPVRRLWDEIEEELLSGFTVKERALLRRLLLRVRRNMR